MSRFTQEDPIGLAGGLNLYGYADADPINFSDPFGLCGAIFGSKAPCELIAAAFSEINPRFGREEARAMAHAIINRAKDPNRGRYGYRNTGNLDEDIVGQIFAPNQVQGVDNRQFDKAMNLLSGNPEQFDPGSSEKFTAAYLGVEQAYAEAMRGEDPTKGSTFWDHSPSRAGQGASRSACAPVSTGKVGSMETAKCSK